MTDSKAFKNLVKKAIELDLFFAVFREPRDPSLTFISQTNSSINYFDPTSKELSSGFVIAPFGKNSPLLIQADVITTSDEHNFPVLNAIKYDLTTTEELPEVTNKSDYIEKLNDLIDDLKKNKAQKVVYSRVKEITAKGHCVDFFLELEQANSDACAYLFNVPGKNTWMGASPEVLLKKQGEVASTMALASTRKSTSAVVDWNQKELEEHRYVSDFIRTKLKNNEIDFEEGNVYNKKLKSGLTHLCLEFGIDLTSANFIDLANDLHPTPAIVGIPLNSAMAMINEYELHQRNYYTGYLGPLNLRNKTALYVNLRCARLTDGKLFLFLGGGITIDSNAHEEWQETELKAQTILKAVLASVKIKIFEP